MSKAADIGVTFFVEVLGPATIPTTLMRAHYEELAPMKALLNLAPDWSQYMEWQQKGEFILVTASNDKIMVGYMAIILRPHLHYRETKMAVDDVHYLAPAYRGVGVGKEMIAFAEKTAWNAGARVFSMQCKAGLNHGYIFEGMGYELTDLVYLKDLSDAVA